MSNGTSAKSGFIWSLIENFSLQGIRFFIGIVMARLLMPSDYGMIGMLTLFMSISDLLINSGIGSALNKKQDRTEKDFCTAFIFNVSVAVLLYTLFFFLSKPIAIFYDVPLLEELTKYVSISLIINSLCIVPMTKLQISLNFRTISLIAVISAVVSGLSGITMAFHGFGVWSLVYSTLLGNMTRCLILYIVVRWHPTAFFSFTAFKEMFAYSSKLLGGVLIESVYSNIYPIVIGKAYSAPTLGYFTRAQGYANLPATTLSKMIDRVCFPVFCKQNDDIVGLRKSYDKMMTQFAIIIFPIMTLLLSLAHPLILIMISEKWKECIPLLQILCISSLWLPLLEITYAYCSAVGESGLVFKMRTVSKLFAIIILAITLNFNIVVMCWGAAFISLFTVLYAFWIARGSLGKTFVEMLKPFVVPFVGAITMFCLIEAINTLIPNLYMQCLIGIVLGVLAYGCVCTWMGYPIVNMIKNILHK